jgi:hypothetical protein
MEKRCNTCGRVVKETVHTAKEAIVDYFETRGKGETRVTCVECVGRYLAEPLLRNVDKQENAEH